MLYFELVRHPTESRYSCLFSTIPSLSGIPWNHTSILSLHSLAPACRVSRGSIPPSPQHVEYLTCVIPHPQPPVISPAFYPPPPALSHSRLTYILLVSRHGRGATSSRQTPMLSIAQHGLVCMSLIRGQNACTLINLTSSRRFINSLSQQYPIRSILQCDDVSTRIARAGSRDFLPTTHLPRVRLRTKREKPFLTSISNNST
jgi:hypothetical protein